MGMEEGDEKLNMVEMSRLFSFAWAGFEQKLGKVKGKGKEFTGCLACGKTLHRLP